jgi:Xaa-Pro aminopeptidase
VSSFAVRRERALEGLAAQDLPALAVTGRHNLRYLTGFTGEGYLLLAAPPVLCTDRRYEIEAQEEAGDCEFRRADRGHLHCLIEAAAAQGLARLGFESDSLTYGQYQSLQKGLPQAELVPTSGVVEKLREIKSPEEIELMARAAAIVDRVLEALLPSLEPGPTEKDLALQLTAAFIQAGADGVSFAPIVACGPRSALPHATVTDRALRAGDILLLDLGAQVGGYCSDITRTLVLGDPPEEFCRRYQAVLAAQRAGIAAVHVGVPAAEVDQAARAVLVEAGLGEAFSHSLGHGVGLEVHEAPGLSGRSEQTLEVGHVFTIEPGVYLESWGGIRIEDQFALEASGLRQLTFAPKLGC